jgi:hypothetical protein
VPWPLGRGSTPTALGFVWTLPRVLRGFLRHHRELYAELGKLLYGLLSRYFCQAAGRKIRTALVSSHQSFGEFASWNPHWHTIVLEGGFDRHDRFFFIPIGAGGALCEAWRRTVVAFFLDKGLLNREFARTLLSWRHSGFSIESGTRIYDTQARQGLCQYIIRAPLSLQKLDRLSRYRDACRSGTKNRIPLHGPHLPRAGFRGTETPAGVYEVDVWACPACGGRMSVIAVIRPSGVFREVWIIVPASGGPRHPRPCRDSQGYACSPRDRSMHEGKGAGIAGCVMSVLPRLIRCKSGYLFHGAL